MRQTYLSLGGGPRVLKATASPKFTAGCDCAAVQQRYCKLLGEGWGRGKRIAIGGMLWRRPLVLG